MGLSPEAAVKAATKDPYEAAKKLRYLARALSDRFKNGHFGPAKKATGITPDFSPVDSALAMLRSAVETRRVSDGRNAYTELWTRVRREREAWTDALGTKSSGNFVEPNNPSVIAQAAGWVLEIEELVQCLPTVPNIPTTNHENVVRALIAVLRTNMIEGAADLTQGTTPTAGIEPVEQDEVDEMGEEESYEEEDD